jgi:hypothetical protein
MKKEAILQEYRRNPDYVLDAIGVRVAKNDRHNLLCHCPLHDDSNPSFSICSSTGQWTCHAGCGNGDLFKLYGEINNFNSKTEFRELLNSFSHDLGLR